MLDLFPHEASNDLAAHLSSKSRTVYAGFDPTADSLHVGNLLVLNALMHSLRAGHSAIALIGGATAKIGDPSGKKKERPELGESEIGKNIRGIAADLKRVAENHAKYFAGDKELGDLVITNNIQWYENVNVLEFLSRTGRYFRLGRMMARESVKSRLDSEEGISLTEFSYQVFQVTKFCTYNFIAQFVVCTGRIDSFQAYDWYHLYKAHGCTVQLGGSDQMGNITAGFDLVNKACDTRVYGVTLPLVTSESGDKLGKSAGDTLWLNEDKTSCFDLYQYFLRQKDADVERLLNLFSFLPKAEISELMKRHHAAPEKRAPHRKLAEQVTLLVHGVSGLELAQKTTDILYGTEPSAALAVLSPEEMRKVFGGQGVDYVRLLFSAGLCLIDFAMKIGCFKSEADAARIIEAGGFYVNQVRRRNAEEVVMPGTHVLPNQTTLVRVGKKNYYIIEWTM